LFVRQEIAIHLLAGKIVVYHDQEELARYPRFRGKHHSL
jgi:hypothetical protein